MTAEAVPHAAELERARAVAERFLANVETVVHGKHDEIRLVLAAFACGGHVLFEDVPGTAKTVLARAVSGSVEGAIGRRIQCTPDLQPSDVTGLAVYDQRTRDFEFRPGPIFGHVVLVDEINRAMPKTQSALLEAMGERQVTVDGVTRPVPHPFLLLATENPIEYEGTFPLPEAQLDRFFLRTSLGYPTAEEELRVIDDQRVQHPLEGLQPVVTLEEIEQLQAAVASVYVDPLIGAWIVALVRATRDVPSTAVGASVRGSLALERAVRAWALLEGRHFVVPADVTQLFLAVVGHRVVLTPAKLAESRRVGRAQALQSFLEECLLVAPPPALPARQAEPAEPVPA
jgi:MoxR-like ATPase